MAIVTRVPKITVRRTVTKNLLVQSSDFSGCQPNDPKVGDLEIQRR